MVFRLTLTLAASVIGAQASADIAVLPHALSDQEFRPVNAEEAKLGQLLFYDPILSGNRNISCATCHHPKFATGDGVSLGLGEGGIGLGPERVGDPANMPEQRIPRNAQALFNLGAFEFRALFHDGRIETDPKRPSGLRTPMDEDMLEGFVSILSAQTMFPVLSQDEMAGHYSENDVAQAVRQGRITGQGGAWDIISKRVEAIAAYDQRFKAVYPDIKDGQPIRFTDISNAIAAFVAFEWRSDQSPFDEALKGDAMLNAKAAAGMDLFYSKAGCSDCHSGPLQTDHQFHAMGVPQIGPGKAARFERHARDTGRMRVTGQIEDAYKFRTPSLRNVTKTAPYGHDGAYSDLSDFLKAHIAPKDAIATYSPEFATLPKFEAEDWIALDDPNETAAISGAVQTETIELDDAEIDLLIAFLQALQDPVALQGRLGIPQSVPSGLPVGQ